MRSVILSVVALAAAMLAGCQSMGGYDRAKLGPAADTVIAGSEALGGLSAWRSDGKVNAMALVTTYDEAGEKYVNVQSQIIDPLGGRIAATAKTAVGRWRASCTSGGRFSLSNADALDDVAPGMLKDALAMILDRFAGPFNITQGRETAGEPSEVWIDNRTLTRVPVSGSGRAVAYYFDAPSGLLQMVTAGADQPGGEGTVTLYTYQFLPDGMTVPKTIRVMRIGQHVLVGPEPVLEVEFTEVRMSDRGVMGLLRR